jgi:hypothetical protein
LYQLELESGHQPETGDSGVQDPPSGSAQLTRSFWCMAVSPPHRVCPDHAVLDAMNARNLGHEQLICKIFR